MCFEIQLQRIVSVLFFVATTSAAADQPKQLQLHGSELMLSVNLQHRPYQVEHKHSDSDDLQVKYEETIATCLGRIHQHLEVCVQEVGARILAKLAQSEIKNFFRQESSKFHFVH